MDLMNLIGNSGGGSSLAKIADSLGIDAPGAEALVGALAPALARGMQKQIETPEGLAGLTGALNSGRHQRYLDEPDLVSNVASIADGNKILGHLFGSKDVSRNVAAQAAESTGLDSGLIKKALPMIAGLAMGAVSKSQKAEDSSGSMLGALLGGLGGSKADDDGLGLDDVMSLAKKFF